MVSISSTLAASLVIASTIAVTIPAIPKISQGGEGGQGGRNPAPPAINNNGYHFKLPVRKEPRNSIEKRAGTMVQAVASRGEFRSAYTIDADIGIPPQKMKLQIDTGSSALWVASSLMPEGERPFDPIYEIRDGDVKAPDLHLHEEYFDGTVADGDVHFAQVSIGGHQVNSHPVGMAKTVPQIFFKGYSGLIGLGVDDQQDLTRKTWFSAIKPELNEPLFAVDFRRNGGSAIDFGYIDFMAYEGEPIYTPQLLDRGKREVEVTGFSIGNQHPRETTVTRAIIDSGTTFISLADSKIVIDYYESFGAVWNEAMEVWTFDCDTEVPNFSFWLGEHSITIPGSIMNRGGLIMPEDTVCAGGLIDHKSNTIIQPERPEELEEADYHLIGMVAFEALYVIYDDRENAERVGFAYKKSLTTAPDNMLLG